MEGINQTEMIQDLEEKKEDILREIEEYNRERDQIKNMLGRIGGEKYSKKDMIINVIFLTIILLVFILELTTHFLPTYMSIEVSILLVSIKIVWMIYSQHKFNHFLFWILNSLEFRMNNIYSRIKKIERMLDQGNTRETNK
jgi:hypothetical protein